MIQTEITARGRSGHQVHRGEAGGPHRCCWSGYECRKRVIRDFAGYLGQAGPGECPDRFNGRHAPDCPDRSPAVGG